MINSKCLMCTERFCNSYKKIYVIYPCKHLVHVDCYKPSTKCTLCDVEIIKLVKDDILELDTQEHINTLSVINYPAEKNLLSYMRAIRRTCFLFLFFVYICIYQLLFNSTTEYFSWKCEKLLEIFEIYVHIHNIQNIDDSSSVFVLNHNSLLDILIAGSMINKVNIKNKEDFFAIASEKSLKSKIFKIISKGSDLILVKRTKNATSTLDKIKQKLSKNKKLTIFPQGIITNNNTISEFRTSAFNLNKPVNPIVIKYEPSMKSMFLMDLLFLKHSFCNIYCLKKIYKKDPIKFKNEVMKKMIGCGGFKFTQITSRDVYD